jgi:hypothetical protein
MEEARERLKVDRNQVYVERRRLVKKKTARMPIEVVVTLYADAFTPQSLNHFLANF